MKIRPCSNYIGSGETAIDEATCDSAIRANLGCIQAQGSLADVTKLNYPAVVHLAEENGREMYAVLLHVADNQADLLLGSQHWKVSIEWLNKVWDQDYTVLWRMPESGTTLISKRSGADDIQWLETKVSQALRQPVRNSPVLMHRWKTRFASSRNRKVYRQMVLPVNRLYCV